MLQIFFIHGFGVQKDSRGMFPEIEKHLREEFSDFCCEYTELNEILDNGENTKVLPFSEQVKLLEEKLTELKSEDFTIIIAHSQGCVISSLLKSIGHISLAIFLAPPSESDFSSLIQRMGKRPGSHIDVHGESILRRSDGSLSYIPAEYFTERAEINYDERYREFTKNICTYLIQAQDDEIIVSENISKSGYKDTFFIGGNHNFDDTPENRKVLLETLSDIIRKNYPGKS